MVLGAALGRITPTPLTLPRFESVAAFATGALARVGLEETTGGPTEGAPRHVGGTAPGVCSAEGTCGWVAARPFD